MIPRVIEPHYKATLCFTIVTKFTFT